MSARVTGRKFHSRQIWSALLSIADIDCSREDFSVGPLAAVSRCSELSYETGQWSIRGLRLTADERDRLVERGAARTGVTHRGVLVPDRHAAEEDEPVRG